MGESVHRAAPLTFAVVAVLAFLGLAAPSFGDPGTPGVTKASEGVYVSGEGEAGGSPQLGNDTSQAPAATQTPSTPQSPSATPAAIRPGASGSTGGLPFTGLIAPILLAAGLIALAAGFSLRAIDRTRPA